MNRVGFLSIISLSIVVMAACSSTKGNYKVTPLAGNTEELKEGLFYMLPKTVLEIELEIEKQESEKGIYAEYAKQFLGISNVNKSETQYRIANVTFVTHAEADPAQTYFVDPQSSALSIHLSEYGVLESVNENGKSRKFSRRDNADNFGDEENLNGKASPSYILHPEQEKKVKQRNFIKVDSSYIELPPISPKSVNEKSSETKAKETAEYIQKVREKKMALLSGEYEDQYSPNAVEFLYQKLDAIEKQYLTLFVGTSKITTTKQKINVPLTKSDFNGSEMTVTIGRFSKENGLFATEGNTQDAITLKLQSQKSLQNISKYSKKQNTGKNQEAGFAYRIPETLNASLYLNNQEISKNVLSVAQFGEVLFLPQRKFKATFDSQSGALLDYRIIKK